MQELANFSLQLPTEFFFGTIVDNRTHYSSTIEWFWNGNRTPKEVVVALTDFHLEFIGFEILCVIRTRRYRKLEGAV